MKRAWPHLVMALCLVAFLACFYVGTKCARQSLSWERYEYQHPGPGVYVVVDKKTGVNKQVSGTSPTKRGDINVNRRLVWKSIRFSDGTALVRCTDYDDDDQTWWTVWTCDLLDEYEADFLRRTSEAK